ncbi:MAG: gliding motility-associated C-terminal domain-containing protein [Bacteroidota bacterium]
MPLGSMKNRAAGLVLLFFLSPLFVLATHLRAGEITVERTNCTSLIFKITITVYTNTGSDIKFGEGILDFGDGSTATTPTIDNTKRPDLGDNIGTVSYSVFHTYAGPGRYVISYLEPNRNGGILNIFNSVETRFYIETVINIDPFLGCNNSPKLLVPPIDKACTGAAWFHNPGAYDPDGDSLSFTMTVPKKEKGQVVGNYRSPNNKEFYDRVNIPYGQASEDGLHNPTFKIDSLTGTITWDAPGMQGEYNIAFLIKEWRKIAGTWVLMGYVTRDMQIIVEDCDNHRPELIVPQDICVEAGTVIDENIFGYDPDSDPVKIEAFSQLLSIEPNRAEITFPVPNDFQPSSPTSHARIVFHWQTSCDNVKEQPYQVVFKITDKPPSGQRLIQFKTWNITVVGPAPKWDDVHKVPSKRQASLTWDPYVCQNAQTMQVWRRVDDIAFVPPECVTGMPEFLGYTQIATVPITQSTYIDTNNGKGLSIGAKYCYRLVAVFPSPGGGESYVSRDTCLAPIPADAPIVTNVSVDKTGATDGQITVKWMSPFQANKIDFPPPYKYEVYRAEGITGDIKLKKVNAGFLTDSTYHDIDPLNTESVIYNYRIIAYDNNSDLVDTSDVASAVRLEAKPQLKMIEINWAAEVPWSNQVSEYKWHRIYRGDQNATDAQLQLIDSVDVTAGAFKYTDDGHWNNTPLKETDTYCYKVMTRGSYGNDLIPSPLENFSQKLCAQPNDNTPPCTPSLTIVQPTCEEQAAIVGCGNTIFSNTLTWSVSCRNDVRSFTIYVADKLGDDFTPYKDNVTDTFFVDNIGLKSFARCYKIQSIDRSGNKSDLSESFCFDNCPYYELPNVFTPNGDGCNPFFSAFSDRVSVDEGTGLDPCGQTPDLDVIALHCARFVEAVDFRVYNRWGKGVYNYTGDVFGQGGEKSIYIDWDGRDNEGHELSEGVYYYVAVLTYDVVDPNQATQTIKGWVHLVR